MVPQHSKVPTQYTCIKTGRSTLRYCYYKLINLFHVLKSQSLNVCVGLLVIMHFECKFKVVLDESDHCFIVIIGITSIISVLIN